MRTDVGFEYLSPPAYAVEPNSLQFQEQNDLGYFMKNAGRYKLLNAKEERALATCLWTARRRLLRVLRASRRDESGIPFDASPPTRVVTPSTRRRLARVERYARGAVLPPGPLRDALSETLGEMDDIRRIFVECNLRLVVWVAKGFRGRGFDFIDLIQEAASD